MITACFFLSGMAGLIYQVIWIRLVDKVLGSAPYSVAAVLTVFMAGLGAGSYLAGRYGERIKQRKSLLSAYGWMEAAIGIYGISSPLLIALLTPVYRAAYNHIFDIFWLYQVLGLLGCGLILLLPVALMGATLPILCRFHVLNLSHLGERTGRLYGINTLGAAAGALLAGFYLIPEMGIWGSLLVAAAFNFIVAALAIFIFPGMASPESRKEGTREAWADGNFAAQVGASTDPLAAADPASGPIRSWALIIFAVSGFCAMSYEVIWTRLLGLLIGPTTYSFTIVVSTFILGLAAGSIVFGWISDRSRDPFKLLVITQMTAAILSVLLSQFLGGGQFFFAKLIYSFRENFPLLMTAQSLILFGILVIPTFFLGAAFPIVNKLYTRSFDGIGRSVGTAYAVNTVGAILGSFAAGFVMIPFMGKENALRIAGGLQFFTAIGGGFYVFYNAGKAGIRRALISAGCIGLGIVFFTSFPSWNRMLLSCGRYRDFRSIEGDLLRTSWTEALFKGNDILARQERGRSLVFYGDGIGGFTTVETLTDSLGTVRYSLLNSGKPDASSHGDRSTQTLLAHLPLLFHPDPKKVMVLGLASGMTAGEALVYPIEGLDVVEISDEVVKACRFFPKWNNKVLENPVSKVILQDGRNHLALTNAVYDVIVSEPSNPWMAGLANLYSKEFFETVKTRLRGNGIFVQWIHSYEMDWRVFSMVGRTFASVFPESAMFATLTGVGDYLLVGFRERLDLDLETASGRVKYAQGSANMSLPDALLLFNLIVSEDLKHVFGDGPLHTDNRPRLEFAAPRALYKSGDEVDQKIRERRTVSKATRDVLEAGSKSELLLDMVEFSSSVLSPLFMLFDPERALPQERARFLALVDGFCGANLVGDYSVFPEAGSRRRCAETQAELMKAQAVSRPDEPDLFFSLGIALREAGEREKAVEAFEKAASLDSEHLRVRNSLGVEYLISGDLAKAEGLFREALKIHPGYATAFFNLAQVSLRRGEKGEAISHLRKGLSFENNAAAKDLLRRLLLS
ncbi:MFS transporter [bacterium]|nr:MFS transporter [bacterium]